MVARAGTPAAHVQQVTMEYQGVLPTPAMFQAFEDVVPGAANRILVMAENEAANRHRMDRRFSLYRFTALAVGGVVAIGGLLICAYLVKRGATGWAVAAFLAVVSALVIPFLVLRRVNSG